MSRDALIVGINSYQYLQSLKAPATDAEAIAQRLAQDTEFRVWRMPERIEQADGNTPALATAQSVSQQQLEQALEQLFLPRSHQAPETALFYFSGHGIPDRKGFDKGYLATSDTSPDYPRSGLSLRWLQWLLSKSQIKQQIVWLDCCHSGSLLINVGAANPGNSGSRDRCFIASSRDFGNSWEDLNSPYSVLTKALLEGLDPSRLSGRSIDTFALVDYVNQALKGELQTPVCTNFGEAINLTRTWQAVVQDAPASTADSGICPYKGLEFFDCNDEDPKYFFCRESLVGELLDHIRTQPFLALVGASGNGKSSVLRAGLLHQLKIGRRITGSEQWQILIARPDAQPMKSLAAAFVPEIGTQVDRAVALEKAEGLLKAGSAGLQQLVEASAAPRILLVIDQFEEVFTMCDREEERLHFFETLMSALAEAKDKLCLTIAIRADFVGKCLSQDYAGLAQQVQTNMISVLPLAEDELRTAICKPAERVGLAVESALVSAIVRDTKDAPGSLPLLQYTLKELWQRRAGGKLKMADYQQLGGIDGTLDQRATEIYNRLDEAQKRTVRHIFQQLTQLGEGTEDTRRRVFLDNLTAEPLHPLSRVLAVIEILSNPDNRLLVTNEVARKGHASEHRAIIDVTHEALIRHWRLLRTWIEQNRDLLRRQRRIESSTVAWQEQEQARGYLLQGIPLAEAIQFREQQADVFPLSEATKAYIQKSVWHRRRSRLKTASWLIVPALLAVGLVEYNVREARIKSDYVSLSSRNRNEQKQAALDLVAGCWAQRRFSVIPNYLVERLSGNCRSLEQVDLSDADLSSASFLSAILFSADLRGADLRGADLSNTNLRRADLKGADLIGADLREADLIGADLSNTNLIGADLRGADLVGANLSKANLSKANLSKADLSEANLSEANLSKADLSRAILLTTNLRIAQSINLSQLADPKKPLVCNSPLPQGIELEGGMNRDCDRLPNVLSKRYPYIYNTLQEAEASVAEYRQKTWE